ncbi:T9SS type A sorting domain-containing protein [Flavobacterium sp. DGU11]|uniref:T9SS type A sorting domain-containing protein n=1 Tax=Flavobacterium arundinis TaxID=3139143 RepID=A0ABU9HZB0_9FLAO
MVRYSPTGTILSNITVPNTYADAVKVYEDGTLLVYSNGYFKLFDSNLNLLKQFSNYYNEVADYNKTDNSHVVAVSNVATQMYPGGQLSQIDVHADLFTETQGVASYTFSGEGTSYCGAQKLLVDTDSNYIVITREQLGESNYSIGGTIAPETAFIYKYDTNFELLWSMELPIDSFLQNVQISECLVSPDKSIFINLPDGNDPKLIKISPDGDIVFNVSCVRAENIYFDQNHNVNIVDTVDNPGNENNTIIYTYSSTDGSLLGTVTLQGVSYLTSYNDNSGNSYVYTYKVNVYSSESKKIRIYKNLVMQSEIPLNISGSSAGIGTPVLNQNGTMFFRTSYYSQSQLFKITPEGLFSVIQIPSELNGLSLFHSGKIFTCHTNGSVRIYNPDLTLFSSNTFESTESSNLLAAGNLMLSKIQYSDDVVRVFNENAELLPEAKIMGTLQPQYARGYANGNLVITGSFGNQLYTYEEYAWRRGLLHKYDIGQYFGLGTDEESFTYNQVNVYPNPSNGFINITTTSDVMVLNTEIYDLTGKLLLLSDKGVIDISSLPAAIYIAKVHTSEGVVSKKIIKK